MSKNRCDIFNRRHKNKGTASLLLSFVGLVAASVSLSVCLSFFGEVEWDLNLSELFLSWICTKTKTKENDMT